jgi:transcriptional regulator with XRE-family HTH domain
MIDIRDLRGETLTAQQIGDAVRTLRTNAGLSQADLAKVLKVSAAAVSQIETGRRLGMKLGTVAKVFEALDHEMRVELYPLKGRPRGELIIRVSYGSRAYANYKEIE